MQTEIEAPPARGLKEPAAHLWQVELFEAPMVVLYIPAGQSTQQVALEPPRPHVLYFPTLQGRQLDALGAPGAAL